VAGGQAVEGAKRGTFFWVEPEGLVLITDKAHPLYDERVERPLTDRFVASLDYYGNGKPILCRKVGEELFVVDGRRRKRGLCAANVLRRKRGDKPLLAKVLIVQADDRLAAALSTTLNEHGEDDDVMTKARKAQRYLGQFGSAQAVADECFQVDVQTVQEWLKLLDTAPAVQEAVAQTRVSPSAAVALAGLPKTEQAEKLATLLAEGPVTARVARAAVRARKGGKTGEDAHPAPNKREVRKALEALESDGVVGDSVNAEHRALLRWVLDGGRPPSFVREALKAAAKAAVTT
jgi:ParB family chromosome partitioning protein